ncbi:glycosyl hydrolase family 18 protein [Rugosimonospora africana]|nr:glycosyl hydrolase family 18 protein [Rugosimonospora africana]
MVVSGLALFAVSGPVSLARPAAAATTATTIPSTASERAELAQWWAPVHFQDVDTSGETAFGGESDYLTSYDFDGDLNGRNNWENASEFPLKAHVYYSVVQTPSFSYLIYMFFHPRDWADAALDDFEEDATEHENDAEGVLIVVANDGSAHGTFKAAITVAHSNFYSWVPEGSDFSSGAEDVDGAIATTSSPHDDGHQRPWTAQQASTHAAWAMGATRKPSPDLGDQYRNGDGILYYPGTTAEVPDGPNDRDVQYTLTDIFAPGGMWDSRNLTTLFATPNNFAGDDSGNPYGAACGEGAVAGPADGDCATDAANPAWAWDDADDLPGKGYLATNPADLVYNYFNWPGKPASADLDYTWNAYNGVTPPDPTAINGGAGDPMEAQPGGDDGGTKPPTGAQNTCRPDGLTPTPGVNTPYCDVYDSDGREWLGQGRSRRVIGYFNGDRTGADGSPYYLVKNIPWSQVTHINYAFAQVENNRISVGAAGPNNPAIGMTWPGIPGAEMDPNLPYQGHFNLLTKYKRLHPRVKTLISVGGWAESAGFYAMTTNANGTVNTAGIATFADSVVDFLRRYGFDGVDIDFEYPTALDQTGNPNDWPTAQPRRLGLPAAYVTLMQTLRDRLDRAAVTDQHYYLLTSAASASGYLVRGMENQKGLRYQDFTNLMAYDFHGTWNDVVGPNAPLYDDGKDPELSDLYTTPEYQGIGYFNTDWAVHYLRGAVAAGRINIGVPYYTRGWRNVTGGDAGMWGTSQRTGCEPGTGITRRCGDGAVGIDNIWHDSSIRGGELGSGTNPMWHAENLQAGVLPSYAGAVGLDPNSDADDRLTGTYERHWDPTTKSAWLWNATKKTYLSIEDEQSVDALVDYVKASGAGGVMIWELSGDYDCPATVTADRPCTMGYTLTRRIHDRLDGAAAPGASRSDGSTVKPPSTTANLTVDLVQYKDGLADLYPMQSVVRITNNTGVTIGGGKGNVLSFDLPTSTSALVKDGNWQTAATGGAWTLTAGRSGPNAGTGLGATFHRVSTTLDYCQIIPAGKSLDLPIKYYLPVTGPVNTTLQLAGKTYTPASENLHAATNTTPPAGGCSAPAWDSTKVYDPSKQPVEQLTVKYQNNIWRAKWWTQGNIPGTGVDSDHEPWKLIGPAS